jgi:hypothetical protein
MHYVCSPDNGIRKQAGLEKNKRCPQTQVAYNNRIRGQADLGNHFSPLVYRVPGGNVAFAQSERYVLLQTYTIKNIKASGNITGLEFYQMLHRYETKMCQKYLIYTV